MPDQLVRLLFELAFLFLFEGGLHGESTSHFRLERHSPFVVCFQTHVESFRASNLNLLSGNRLVFPEDLQSVTSARLDRNNVQRELFRSSQLEEVSR
jgi:hypothetical protein